MSHLNSKKQITKSYKQTSTQRETSRANDWNRGEIMSDILLEMKNIQKSFRVFTHWIMPILTFVLVKCMR